MILTNCAACAAPLAHTAPRCVRCQTRYCIALNLAQSLGATKRYQECKSFLREQLPGMRRTLGEKHELYEKMRCNYASLLFNDTGSSRDELVEAVAIFEELTLTARRVYGPSHPQTKLFEHHFELSKSDPRLVVRAPSV